MLAMQIIHIFQQSEICFYADSEVEICLFRA